MGGGRAYHARDAGLAVALALESIPGVNPAVTFFDNLNTGEIRLRQGLRHGERVDMARFDVMPYGGTPMAEAIWHAAHEVTKCKEQRKLIICITDGQPNDIPATKEVIGLCNASGVETVGIGIETDHVTTLFRRAVTIQSAAELRGTLFELLGNSLIAA